MDKTSVFSRQLKDSLMDVHLSAWIILSIIVIGLITFDVVAHVRTPHEPTIKESAWWSVGYTGLALLFGGGIWLIFGAQYGAEYLAGWATEKALSIDNLFVFVIIIAAFRVPRAYQQKALLFGIVIAIILRLIFILLGAAIIERFHAVFYIFGMWLLWTAYTQVREGVGALSDEEEDAEYEENKFTKFMRRFLPFTEGFEGQKFFVRHAGKTFATPMLLVVIALGTADIMFAFDSIPAIFGLTQEPFLVFSANAFALLGLRQMYFLIDALLSRLVYLHWGLAAILAFIGVKLIMDAMSKNNLSFLNGGQPFAVPEIGIGMSLLAIGGTMAVTVVASLIASHRKGRQENV